MSLCKQDIGEDNLLLGDYVVLRLTGTDADQHRNKAPSEVLIQYDYFFQRILKQRGELSGTVSKRDSVINIRHRNREVLQNTSPTSKASEDFRTAG